MKFTLKPQPAATTPPPKLRPVRPSQVPGLIPAASSASGKRKSLSSTAAVTQAAPSATPAELPATPDERWEAAKRVAATLPQRAPTTHKFRPPSATEKKLAALCKEAGCDVGLVKWNKAYNSAETTITAFIIIGEMHEVAVDGDNLDACYEKLIEKLVARG